MLYALLLAVALAANEPFVSSHHNTTNERFGEKAAPQEVGRNDLPEAPALISHLVVPIYESDYVSGLQALIEHWRAHPACDAQMAGEGKSLKPHLGSDGKMSEVWRYDQTELTVALVAGSIPAQLLALVPSMFAELQRELGGCFHRVNLVANRAVKIDRELDGLEGSRRKLQQALLKGGLLQSSRVPVTNALVMEMSVHPIRSFWLDGLFSQLHGTVEAHAEDGFWMAADWQEDQSTAGLGITALTHLTGAYLINLSAASSYPALLASLNGRPIQSSGSYADGVAKRRVESPALARDWQRLSHKFIQLDWALSKSPDSADEISKSHSRTYLLAQ